eukprot:scaffold28267_cov35-Tisochrysis_lutea.AAC.2
MSSSRARGQETPVRRQVCDRDVRLLQELGFDEADAVEALRVAPMFPSHNSRVESAAHLLCLSPGSVEQAAARSASSNRSVGSSSSANRWIGSLSTCATYASPPCAQTSGNVLHTSQVEYERRRLHELLVTTPPDELVYYLRERILREDAIGTDAVRMLSLLLPLQAWPQRWSRLG